MKDPLEEMKKLGRETPPGLYDAPSFKFRHELREPLESSDAAYRRAHPEFFTQPRRRGFRRRGMRRVTE